MLRLADVCHAPPTRTPGENGFRSPRYDVHIAKIGYGDAPMEGICLEYVQNTHPENTWTKWIRSNFPANSLGESCRLFADAWHFDGMFLDTPFENIMPVLAVQQVVEFKKAMGDKITCPNYGDMFTFMGEGTLGLASLKMQEQCNWGMCEVAVNLEKPFDASLWRRVREYTTEQLNNGKHIILGIHDLNGDKIADALAIMHSLEHPNLYWKYFCGKPGQHGEPVNAYCWHPLLEIARGI
jgi:hypothetical protein